jgi:BirA family biotin operon repressor/biotin-[acetyl-CoA-carboxylase] ligase
MYEDLDRPPLSERELRRGLVEHGPWRDLRVVAETGSTNADVSAAARAGVPEGLVVVAESQSAGRGRLGRSWQAPPRSGLTFSVLLRPAGVPPARWGWLPMLAGVAVAASLRRVAALDVVLKWPNDVLVGERKLAGILAERVGDAVVIGLGLNVGLTPAELPVPTATSLAIEEGATTDRSTVLRGLLRELAERYSAWVRASGRAGGSGLGAAYRDLCATIGSQVRVELPGGEVVEGIAREVDDEGRLLVADRALVAGDVVHLRRKGTAPPV